ncbi:MAG: ankyrin repeat domain-containing protein [Spirochaetes bacterium]|nr:ankyrin repeat domain-containing protein [Spirochaetota bacterium]
MVRRRRAAPDREELDALFSKVRDDDYLVRYNACRKILRLFGIDLEVSDLRRVFGAIVTPDLRRPTDEDRSGFRAAAENLGNFIEGFGKPLIYDGLTQEELNGLLLDTCYVSSRKPDLDIIRELVSRGADINAADEEGFTAFMLALRVPDGEIIRFFLEGGADVNSLLPYRADRRTTVWIEKAGYVDVETLELMLSRGARVHDRDAGGNTALHNYCAGRAEPAGIRLLVERGADVNAANSRGERPLHRLSSHAVDLESLRALIKAGARVNETDSAGATPLHLAAAVRVRASSPVIPLLEAGADPDRIDASGSTPLMIAVENENGEAVRALVQSGADPAVGSRDGMDAYALALHRGYLAIARLMGGERADRDYRERPEYAETTRLKEEIIRGLRSGKRLYRSDKEGYSYFSFQDGVFVYERYDEGQEPPSVSIYRSKREALRHLYDSFRYRPGDKSEPAIYRDILESLR